jgi:hypothetical protein
MLQLLENICQLRPINGCIDGAKQTDKAADVHRTGLRINSRLWYDDPVFSWGAAWSDSRLKDVTKQKEPLFSGVLPTPA